MSTDLHTIRTFIPEVSVIIPCYNEQENIPGIYSAVKKNCDSRRTEIIFVDDGSTDGTAGEIRRLSREDSSVRLVSFLKNAGHQLAIRAGLREAEGDFIITLDADLQHPPEMIPLMLAKAEEGYDVVSMVRKDKQKGILKNLFSKGFYWFFNSISAVRIQPDSSDFRLMTRKVLDIVNALPERNLVLRAVLPHFGFPTALIGFSEQARQKGKQSYTFCKSLNLAYHAIFNFTTFPLEIGFKLGLGVSFFAFLYGFYAIYIKLFTNQAVPGYTDIITSVLFLSGLILVYLGILGKYLSVIIEQLKKRPEYLFKKDEKEGKKGD